MAQDTTTADAILKNVYLPVVREMVNQRAILLFGYSPAELASGLGHANAMNGETLDYRGISRDADKVQFAGRKWVFTAHKSRNESGNARDEGGYLPTAGQQGWEDFEGTVRRFYKPIQISGFAIEVSNRDVGSYVQLLSEETEGAVNDLRYDLNRQGYGNQTGALCAVTADGSNTLTVDSLQYLRVGMYVDVINSTNDAVLASNRQITAINTSTKVITYSGADVTGTTDHRLCLPGNWKKEINGLRNIVDSATYPTLHNVNGSTAGNEYWNGVKYDGASAVFDEDQAQQLVDEIGVGGWETEIIITTRGVRRRYANTMKAQKRFNDADSGKLHGGFKYILFNEIPLTYDDQCPKGYAFFLRPQDFLWIWLGGEDFRWLDRDGRVLRMVTDSTGDKDEWRAYLYKFMDLGCFRRKTQGMIHSLLDDAAKPMS